jgi:hypothetical protein
LPRPEQAIDLRDHLIGMFWDVLGCFGMFWDVLGCFVVLLSLSYRF